MRLSRINSLPVVLEGADSPAGTVQDGLLDLKGRRAVYWCVRLDGVSHPVLISAARSDLHEDHIEIRLDQEALNLNALPATLDQDTLAAGTLPDVIGPGTCAANGAPSGLGRVWNALERAWRPAMPEKPANSPSCWVWGREMTGKPFFSSEGELGRISDIDIELADGGLRQIQVAQRGGVTLHINMEALRHIPDGKSHFVARSAYTDRRSASAKAGIAKGEGGRAQL